MSATDHDTCSVPSNNIGWLSLKHCRKAAQLSLLTKSYTIKFLLIATDSSSEMDTGGSTPNSPHRSSAILYLSSHHSQPPKWLEMICQPGQWLHTLLVCVNTAPWIILKTTCVRVHRVFCVNVLCIVCVCVCAVCVYLCFHKSYSNCCWKSTRPCKCGFLGFVVAQATSAPLLVQSATVT